MAPTTTSADPATPLKRKRADDEAVVVPRVTPTPLKKRDEDRDDARWAAAMAVFAKFQPGLGHDGVGLYGTLTPPSARKVLDRLEVRGRTHVDVGAADGKMLLGAVALGARHSYGLEVAGGGLETKFNAMRGAVAAKYGEPSLPATLKCETDVTSLEGDVLEWLRTAFSSQEEEDHREDVVLSAVWHGFTVEAKTALLRAIAKADGAVRRFALVGPVRKDFGDPDDVLTFLAAPDGGNLGRHRVLLAHHDRVTLAGGEAHRALVFDVLP